MNFDESVLRKWDIRGIYPDEINVDLAERLGFSFARLLKDNNLHTCVVGRDNRIGGKELAEKLVNSLLDAGIDVVYLDIVTTPLLNFTCHKVPNCFGIMITASHNPQNENGFKVFGNDCLHLSQEMLTTLYNYIKENKKEHSELKGKLEKLSSKDNYIKYMLSDLNLNNKKLKVVIDCGNGTASTLIRDVYQNLNCDVTYLYCDSDPTFPNHHPDPNVFENLKDLQKKVVETNSDLGIAYDGDADRVGIVDNLGNIIETDKLMAIYSKDILSYSSNKNIVIDVKCSMALEDAIKKCGGKSIMVCNGSAYIETYVQNCPACFGGEYSGHVFFNDRHFGFDDGIYAGLRVQEILCKTDKNLNELSDDYQKLYNTPEIKVKSTDEKKFDVVNKMKDYCISKNYKYLDIDGVRAIFDDGWALIRCSNTGPNITMRFEATTEERLEEIKEEFTNKMNELI